MKDRGISVGKKQTPSSWGLSLASKPAKRSKRRGSHALDHGTSSDLRNSHMRESRDTNISYLRREINEASPEDDKKYAEMNRLLEERLMMNQSEETYDSIDNHDIML
jgi:hypothetical protein